MRKERLKRMKKNNENKSNWKKNGEIKNDGLLNIQE